MGKSKQCKEMHVYNTNKKLLKNRKWHLSCCRESTVEKQFNSWKQRSTPRVWDKDQLGSEQVVTCPSDKSNAPPILYYDHAVSEQVFLEKSSSTSQNGLKNVDL